MRRQMMNPVSKQELRIRRQESEIESYISDRESCPEFIRDKMYPMSFTEKFGKVYKEATERVSRRRLILRGRSIDDIISEDSDAGNYPMNKYRLLALIDGLDVPFNPQLREFVDMGEMSDTELYSFYLKEVKHLI